VTTGEIISQQSVTKVNQAIAAVKDLKRTAGDIRIEYRGNGLERLNGQANQTVRNFEQIIRDTPSFAISAQQGFIAISNNIGPLTDSFGRLAQEAKASGKSITSALAGALGGWNAIGIAISLAVTAVAVFGKEIFSASKDVEKLKDKFKEIKDIIDNTKFVVPEAVGNTAGDRLEAASLAATLSNANKPLQERAKALARLQQLDKELFAGFTVGQKNYDSLGDAVDKYTAKIEKQAAQEARLQDISKKTAERNKLEVQLEGVNKELDVLANTVTFIDPFSGEQLKGGGKRVDELRKQAKDIQTLINNLNQSIAQQTGEVFAFSIAVDTSDATGGSTSLDDELKRILQSRRDRLESELKNLSTISERYFTIQQEIASLDLQIKNIGEVNREVKSNNFEGYQNALEGINIAAKAAGVELTNLKLTLADPAFFAAPNIEPFAKLRQDAINAKLEIDKLFRSGSLTEEEKLKAEAELEFNIQADVLNAQKELDSYQLLIKTGIAPQLEPVVPDQTIPRLPELADDAQMLRDMGYGLEDWNQKLRNSLKPMEEFQQRLADLNKEIANIVASGVADLFGNLFDALNEDGKLTFEEIGNAVRDFVQDLIKAIGKLLIFKAIISAFGLDSVAAIAGPLVRARKFATGGVVTGPTFGLVGEAGPEAVLPLSFLNNLFTNVGGDANLQARVSGQDLLFLMERASKANNRYF
jgi:hypothetical protein